jgi:hypothetical protein
MSNKDVNGILTSSASWIRCWRSRQPCRRLFFRDLADSCIAAEAEHRRGTVAGGLEIAFREAAPKISHLSAVHSSLSVKPELSFYPKIRTLQRMTPEFHEKLPDDNISSRNFCL